MLIFKKITIFLILIITISNATECTKEYIKPTIDIKKLIEKTIGFDVLNNFDNAISKFRLKRKLRDNFMVACSYNNMFCANGYYPQKTGVYYYDSRECCKSITYIKIFDSKYFKRNVVNVVKKQIPQLDDNLHIRVKIKKHYISISCLIYNSYDANKYEKVSEGPTFIAYSFDLEDNDVKTCIKHKKELEHIHKNGSNLKPY